MMMFRKYITTGKSKITYCKNASYAKQGFKLGGRYEENLICSIRMCSFIKTGGLADVCGALPKTFDHKDWDVRVVIPNYSCIPENTAVSLSM